MNFDNISLLVPYKPDGSYREQNWNWIKKRHELLMPEIEICIGDVNIEPYSRAAGINSAAKQATRNIFIIADADLIFNIKDIEYAISLLNKYNFILPYNKLIQLSKEKTKLLLTNDFTINTSDIDIDGCNIHSKPMVGGMCIITKEVFNSVGGMDERFRGWGWEDNAFFKSIKSIKQEHIKTENAIWHLYHDRKHKTTVSKERNRNLLIQEYGSRDKILETIEMLKNENGFK